MLVYNCTLLSLAYNHWWLIGTLINLDQSGRTVYRISSLPLRKLTVDWDEVLGKDAQVSRLKKQMSFIFIRYLCFSEVLKYECLIYIFNNKYWIIYDAIIITTVIQEYLIKE